MFSAGDKSAHAVLTQTLKASRSVFGILALFSFGINLLMLSVPIFMLQLFDRVISSRSVETLLVLTGIAVTAIVALALLDFARSWTISRVGTWLEHRISGLALAGSVLENLSNPSGPRPSVIRDISLLRSFLSGPAALQLLDTPWTPLFILVIFLLHPVLGWIALGGWMALMLVALIYDRMTRVMFSKAAVATGAAEPAAQGLVRSADAVEAMGMLSATIGTWSVAASEAANQTQEAANRTAFFASLARFLRLLMQIIMLAAGAWLVTQYALTPGGMIAASILMARALAPVEQSVASWRSFLGARGAFLRVSILLKKTPMRGAATPIPKPSGRLALDRVTYTIPGTDDQVVRGVSFELEPGECLGIVGPTASGKSTLARLIVGAIHPRLGTVRLDGMDLSNWEADDRGQHVGFLPQDVELLPGTIRQNVSRFSGSDPELAFNAARQAGVHDLILNLARGYDTYISDGGKELSGGQQQRIGLARALYGSPSLIVLDEPNANLDGEGELALAKAIASLREAQVTTIVVAHRPNLLQVTDKLLILDQGLPKAFGPTETLLPKLVGDAQTVVPLRTS